ncbi:MAG: hypothetical protein ABR611_15645 [Chthoniobacterales bacterium]
MIKRIGQRIVRPGLIEAVMLGLAFVQYLQRPSRFTPASIVLAWLVLKVVTVIWFELSTALNRPAINYVTRGPRILWGEGRSWQENLLMWLFGITLAILTYFGFPKLSSTIGSSWAVGVIILALLLSATCLGIILMHRANDSSGKR